MKLLALDLETSPNVAHVWGLWQNNVSLNQLMESTRVICVGFRWYGTKGVVVKNEFHDGRETMLEEMHVALDEADCIITWNGKSFDEKHLNREFLEAGIPPPSPYQHVDLMLEVKKKFRFPSNKLQYVSTALGLEGKVKHQGHELWVRAMAGDPKAWATMVRYQKRDVDLLIELYDVLLPWITKHPNMVLFTGTEGCPKCGSTDLEKRGLAHTALASFQQCRCRSCGSWSRHGKAENRADLRGTG